MHTEFCRGDIIWAPAQAASKAGGGLHIVIYGLVRHSFAGAIKQPTVSNPYGVSSSSLEVVRWDAMRHCFPANTHLRDSTAPAPQTSPARS